MLDDFVVDPVRTGFHDDGLLRRAELLLELDRPDRAIPSLEGLLADSPSFQARDRAGLHLVVATIRTGDEQRGRSLVDAWKAAFPGHPMTGELERVVEELCAQLGAAVGSADPEAAPVSPAQGEPWRVAEERSRFPTVGLPASYPM